MKKKECPYCGIHMTEPPRHWPPGRPHPNSTATKDHVIPRSLGGWRSIIVCRKCNNEKANKAPKEWIEYLISIGDERRAAMARDAFRKAGFYIGIIPK